MHAANNTMIVTSAETNWGAEEALKVWGPIMLPTQYPMKNTAAAVVFLVCLPDDQLLQKVGRHLGFMQGAYPATLLEIRESTDASPAGSAVVR